MASPARADPLLDLVPPRCPYGGRRLVKFLFAPCCCSTPELHFAFSVMDLQHATNRNCKATCAVVRKTSQAVRLVVLHDVGESSQRVLRYHPDYATL